MLIKIEIDVKPEELRTFLGLPDVAGLQEDVLRYVRDQFGQGGAEDFDLAAFIRDTTRSSTHAWQRLFSAAFNRAQEAAADNEAGEAPPPGKESSPQPRDTGASRGRAATAHKSRSRGTTGRATRDPNDES